MNQKIKWIAGVGAFVLLIAGSAVLYNILSERSDNGALVPISPPSSAAPQQPVSSTEASSEVSSSQSAEEATPQKIAAPDFEMEDAQGNTVRLSDLRGKPVVLNFWATWCGYCVMEMPHFDEVWKQRGDEIQFVMLDAVDGASETKEMGLAYIDKNGYSFPIYFDTKQEGGNAFGVRGLPTTYFIDKDGYIVAAASSALDRETLEKGIAMAEGKES